ncbi:MAG: ABC transporter permease [Candidatus Bathyarchaeota archaeon]|nr:ABC transporter permease [Candidatus Termiticorpusculum sp.]MCL1970161.1 ABC transporter permease [Candidatus Termiticorpusculum sp.]
MLKGFTTILLKELKELIRDPKILVGMIIVPLVIFPVMGFVMGYAFDSVESQTQGASVLVVNNDNEEWSQTFITYLNSSMNVQTLNGISAQQVIDQKLLAEYNSSQFIEIPAGFSQNMTRHVKGEYDIVACVNIYGVFQNGGIFSDLGSSVLTVYVNAFNRAIAPDAVFATQTTIIKDQVQEGVDPATLSTLMMSQSLALPVTVMIMITYAMQIAATSVAMEKEEKTLETLLTVPVDRFAILMGKVASTVIISGIATITVLIGYSYMIGSISMGIPSAVNVDLVTLGLVPSTFGYIMLGISLFVTLLSALALAVVLSTFSENVRGAQALVGNIYPLIFIPSMALMYLDINSLPAAIKTVLYAIPYSHPIIASKAVVMGDYTTVALGILYVSIFTVVIMYVASKLFSTEKILTAKLMFKKNSKKKPEDTS